MHELGEIDRRTLIDLYLKGEQIKKNKPIPPDYASLDFNDPNALDDWFLKYRYKPGTITGFRRWVHVHLSTTDLLGLCTTPDKFPEHPTKRLGDLIHLPSFKDQKCPVPSNLPIWWERHSRGIIAAEFPIILRPTTLMNRRHRATLWIEDGFGRTALYLSAILRLNLPSQLTAYVGLDPDPNSSYLRTKFGGELLRNAHKYQSLEDALASSKPSLPEQLRHIIGRLRKRYV
jgi:hypothetical protein